MTIWGAKDIASLRAEAVAFLPAHSVDGFIAEVEREALWEKAFPLDRENKAEAKRLKTELDAFDLVLSQIDEDRPDVRRHLRMKRELCFMQWQRTARQKESNLPTRKVERRKTLLADFCRLIAVARGCHIGHLPPGSSPSGSVPASGVVPLVASALCAVGYRLSDGTIYADVIELVSGYRPEADLEAEELAFQAAGLP